jgi:hypothetical protein
MWKQIKINKFFRCSLLHSLCLNHFLTIFSKIPWCVFSITLYTHTKLHKSKEYAESQQWMDWHLSDFLVHWLPSLITVISYKHIQHYACVDVLPEDTLAWMPYFTHHKHTGAHHYACMISYKTNLSNECFITYFTAIGHSPQCRRVCIIRLFL